MKNYTKKQVLDAIASSAGVLSYVAVKLNCGWHCARDYVNKWEDTKAAFEVAACKLDAQAYKSFIEAIQKGERWAVERVLDTSARRDGHGSVQHSDIDVKSNGETIESITVNVVDPKQEDDDTGV